MKKIGNIILNNELINHTKLEYIHYIKMSDAIEYGWDNLPTLIVGWEVVKNIYKNSDKEISILEKELEKSNLYWEFSFLENKPDHVSGIELFSRNIPYYYFNNKYEYINIDPVMNNINEIEKLYSLLPEKFSYVYNYKNEMLYCLNNKNIYGLDLNMFETFGFDKTVIINNLMLSIGNYIQDEDGNKYDEYSKIYPNYEDLRRYLIVLLSNN